MTNDATLEVVGLMNISMGREDVHDHEMDLAAMWKFNSMQTIETREKCMWVFTYVHVMPADEWELVR